ncbi:hypothetical protein ACFWVC_31845 [Streptomyces sp. NPDC058691]|uniref:hypothetical protein n=1 Tax=Streptomyces sp. NPDC058691 TaxID=3346601 RepID=UPI0036486225
MIALIIALVPTLIAWGITVWQMRIQRVRQVEDVYVARYWTLLDKMSPSTLRGARVEDLDQKAVIRLYFRLSEDEADLRAQGWVSKDTWHIWSSSIHSQLHRQPFEHLWNETLEDSDAGHEYQFTHLRRLWHDSNYDPAPTRGARRWLRLASPQRPA